MLLNNFDRDNVSTILAGEGNWFTAELLRLIAKADPQNRFKLARGFPAEVALVQMWEASDEAMMILICRECFREWSYTFELPISLTEFTQRFTQATCPACGGKNVRMLTGEEYRQAKERLRAVVQREGGNDPQGEKIKEWDQ